MLKLITVKHSFIVDVIFKHNLNQTKFKHVTIDGVCELHTELCLCPLKSGGGGQWQDNSWFHLFAMCNYGCFL